MKFLFVNNFVVDIVILFIVFRMVLINFGCVNFSLLIFVILWVVDFSCWVLMSRSGSLGKFYRGCIEGGFV